jgi:SAM-dependent MidA family methyltransferase
LTIAGMIRERGPMTVAAFMDLALYDPRAGYYARAPRRSGRAGDFFTSVDVGPLFGELLAIQIADMAGIVESAGGGAFTLVEAGAGDGRLAADIGRAMRARRPDLYRRAELHLVEASAAARAAQAATLREAWDRPVASTPSLPDRFDGVLLANELLDALPVHQVVMRDAGLREVYVRASSDGRLDTVEGPPSTPALAEYLERQGVMLQPGWRVEVNLQAIDWVREAARRLGRGFIVLVDYGHEARELYSPSHAGGTLTTFSRHVMQGADAGAPAWLQRPGAQDITSHVDFTSVRAAAEAEGLTTLGFMDQTYFVVALVPRLDLAHASDSITRQLKTLLLPGGLGSTMKVLILAKDVGRPPLAGCSSRMRVT